MVHPLLTGLRATRTPLAHSFKSSARRPQGQQVRFASTGSGSTQEKAQEKAKDALAAAQKGFARAAEMARKASGGVGERVGNMLGSYREPLLYNLSVGRELLKQVYIAERLNPPTSFSTITSAYQTLWSRASNPAYWRELMRSGEYKRVGVYAIEAYGIFKIGEILGRRHIVGYKLD